ncbi:hypothetical protein QCA50_011678 [Cerrena zonata]|uniref:F-box domain-containing protein n=1 Tax=Cerrena zonata TaxID=2478898 RepID=A0AAW0G8F5_9APHY
MSLMQITEADEQVQRNIADDIIHHLQTVTVLRRRLNSFVRINRLPPELLSEIFYFCQNGVWNSDLPVQTTSYGYVASSLRWTYIAVVCSHWRQVAIQTPKLWARVNLNHPSFAINRALVLSKRSPLHLTASKWSQEQITLINDIPSHMDRLHSVNWSFHDGNPSNHLDLKPSPAITTPLRSICVINKHLSAITSIISIFEKCELPSIQRLELQNCIHNLPSCLLGPTLTHLKLKTEKPQPINLETLINSLSHMSRLEILHLQGVSFVKTGSKHAPNVARQKLPLPSLRQLVIKPPSGAHQDYLSLLEALELPTETRLQLMFTNAMPDKDILTLLRVTLAFFRPLVFRSLALCNTGPAFVAALWDEVVCPDALDKREPDPPYGLWLHTSFQTQSTVWDEFLHILDLHQVETVHFGDLHVLHSVQKHWKRLLCSVSDLKCLSLQGEVAHVVVKLLREIEDDNPDTGGLATQVIQFLDVIWCSLDEVREENEGEFMEDLLVMLWTRAETTGILTELVLRRCVNMDEFVVETLKEEVMVVDWDGYIDFEEGSESEESYDYDHYDALDNYDPFGE